MNTDKAKTGTRRKASEGKGPPPLKRPPAPQISRPPKVAEDQRQNLFKSFKPVSPAHVDTDSGRTLLQDQERARNLHAAIPVVEDSSQHNEVVQAINRTYFQAPATVKPPWNPVTPKIEWDQKKTRKQRFFKVSRGKEVVKLATSWDSMSDEVASQVAAALCSAVNSRESVLPEMTLYRLNPALSALLLQVAQTIFLPDHRRELPATTLWKKRDGFQGLFMKYQTIDPVSLKVVSATSKISTRVSPGTPVFDVVPYVPHVRYFQQGNHSPTIETVAGRDRHWSVVPTDPDQLNGVDRLKWVQTEDAMRYVVSKIHGSFNTEASCKTHIARLLAECQSKNTGVKPTRPERAPRPKQVKHTKADLATAQAEFLRRTQDPDPELAEMLKTSPIFNISMQAGTQRFFLPLCFEELLQDIYGPKERFTSPSINSIDRADALTTLQISSTIWLNEFDLKKALQAACAEVDRVNQALFRGEKPFPERSPVGETERGMCSRCGLSFLGRHLTKSLFALLVCQACYDIDQIQIRNGGSPVLTWQRHIATVLVRTELKATESPSRAELEARFDAIAAHFQTMLQRPDQYLDSYRQCVVDIPAHFTARRPNTMSIEAVWPFVLQDGAVRIHTPSNLIFTTRPLNLAKGIHLPAALIRIKQFVIQADSLVQKGRRRELKALQEILLPDLREIRQVRLKTARLKKGRFEQQAQTSPVEFAMIQSEWLAGRSHSKTIYKIRSMTRYPGSHWSDSVVETLNIMTFEIETEFGIRFAKSRHRVPWWSAEAIPESWTWEDAHTFSAERESRAYLGCNRRHKQDWDDNAFTMFLEMLFQFAVRLWTDTGNNEGSEKLYSRHEKLAMQKKYEQLLHLPLVIETCNPCAISFGHIIHKTNMATGFPKTAIRLRHRIEKRCTIRLEAWFENMGMNDIDEGSFVEMRSFFKDVVSPNPRFWDPSHKIPGPSATQNLRVAEVDISDEDLGWGQDLADPATSGPWLKHGEIKGEDDDDAQHAPSGNIMSPIPGGWPEDEAEDAQKFNVNEGDEVLDTIQQGFPEHILEDHHGPEPTSGNSAQCGAYALLQALQNHYRVVGQREPSDLSFKGVLKRLQATLHSDAARANQALYEENPSNVEAWSDNWFTATQMAIAAETFGFSLVVISRHPERRTEGRFTVASDSASLPPLYIFHRQGTVNDAGEQITSDHWESIGPRGQFRLSDRLRSQLGK